MTISLRTVVVAVATCMVGCQAPTGPTTIDCGPLVAAECARATEAAKRELDEEWPFIERVVFVENGWDAFTWDGEWRAFRTDR